MDLCHNAFTNMFLWLQVSERAGHIIQYDKFYIHELDELIDIRNDYVTWIQRQMYPLVSLQLMSPSHLSMFEHLYEPSVLASVFSGS